MLFTNVNVMYYFLFVRKTAVANGLGSMLVTFGQTPRNMFRKRSYV